MDLWVPRNLHPINSALSKLKNLGHTNLQYVHNITYTYLKVAFFKKCDLFFKPPSLQNKNILKELSWAWNLNLLFTVIGGKFKFKFRIVFWNIFILEIGRFEKRIALSEKKPTLGEGELISQISTFLRRPQKFAQ